MVMPPEMYFVPDKDQSRNLCSPDAACATDGRVRPPVSGELQHTIHYIL